MSEHDGPYGSPLLGDLYAMHQQAHEREHMNAEAFMTAVFSFVEGLSNADLVTFRRILSLEQKSVMLNMLDGLVLGYMRWVRDVDPETGRTVEEAAADAAAADAGKREGRS